MTSALLRSLLCTLRAEHLDVRPAYDILKKPTNFTRVIKQVAASQNRCVAHAVSSTADVLSGAQRLSTASLVDSTDDPELQHSDSSFPQIAGLPLSGCEPDGPRLRIALLLSGGVDSSLALRLLQAAGHEVKAFYLQIWFQEDFRNYWDACPWEEDLAICQQVCEQAGVELHTVPLTEQYWQRVVSHCLSEIKAGRTPNPDMLCNSRVKFGAFYEYLEEQHGAEFDRIASGHYARLLRDPQNPSGPLQLALTPDPVKDQTYFLAHLTQQQLSRTIFPLGPLTKGEVRRWAVALELPNQARRDSQGICFLGKVRFSEFVREHLGTWPGPMVEEETGELLDVHEGFWFYTLGQRKGIHLSGGPWFVSRKDPDMNVVYVSRNYYDEDRRRDTFVCGKFNWIVAAGHNPTQPLFCKVRHGPNMYRCTMEDLPGGEARVVLQGNDQGLAAGQFACFYQDGVCLGSAVVLRGSCGVDEEV